MVEEREGGEEVKSYDVGPSGSTRSRRVGLFEVGEEVGKEDSSEIDKRKFLLKDRIEYEVKNANEL